MNQQEIKEAKQYLNVMAEKAAESFTKVYAHLFQNEDAPNIFLYNDNLLSCSIIMEPEDVNLNIVVYHVNDNDYLLKLSTVFPTDDIGYPEEDPCFILRGVPKLGVHEVEKPIMANGIYEAFDLSLDYILGNIKDIIIEALGGGNLL